MSALFIWLGLLVLGAFGYALGHAFGYNNGFDAGYDKRIEEERLYKKTRRKKDGNYS